MFTDRLGWLERLGYLPPSMGPQLFLTDALFSSATPASSTFYEFFTNYFPPGSRFPNPSFVSSSTSNRLAPKSGLLFKAKEFSLDLSSVTSAVPESAIGSSFETPEDWQPRVSTSDGPLGPGVVASRIPLDGEAMSALAVRGAPATSPVAEVFSAVLKNVEFLDLHYTSAENGKERFYLTKPDGSSLGEDLSALRSRLGKSVNVTTSAVISGSSNAVKMTDVVVETDSAELHIR